MITLFNIKIMTKKKYDEINGIKKDIKYINKRIDGIYSILIKKDK